MRGYVRDYVAGNIIRTDFRWNCVGCGENKETKLDVAIEIRNSIVDISRLFDTKKLQSFSFEICILVIVQFI